MDILTLTKEELDAEFGRPTFAQALIGGGLQVESCWEYEFAGTVRLRVGFYNNIARYCCFVKGTLQQSLKFDLEEVAACLISIADDEFWTPNPMTAPVPPPLPANYRCRDAGVTALAWHRDDKPYVFAYVPKLTGQRVVIPNQATLDAKFPTVFQVIRK
jgi:hypothetical protein